MIPLLHNYFNTHYIIIYVYFKGILKITPSLTSWLRSASGEAGLVEAIVGRQRLDLPLDKPAEPSPAKTIGVVSSFAIIFIWLNELLSYLGLSRFP